MRLLILISLFVLVNCGTNDFTGAVKTNYASEKEENSTQPDDHGSPDSRVSDKYYVHKVAAGALAGVVASCLIFLKKVCKYIFRDMYIVKRLTRNKAYEKIKGILKSGDSQKLAEGISIYEWRKLTPKQQLELEKMPNFDELVKYMPED